MCFICSLLCLVFILIQLNLTELYGIYTPSFAFQRSAGANIHEVRSGDGGGGQRKEGGQRARRVRGHGQRANGRQH